MSCRRPLIAVRLLPLLLLAACSPGAAVTPIPTVVLGTNPATSRTGATASGIIVPAQTAELGFPLTGVVRAVSVEVGQTVAAGQQLAALDTSILEAQVKVADADLQATQISYTYLARSGTDQEHLDSAMADVARAQALLDSAKATLAQATLYAPFNGTIASVDIRPAESVVPGQMVITMGDLSHFRVETTDLSERDAPAIEPGQAADIHVVALNQTFAGRVTDISRVSTTIGGDVVYKVTIEFDTQPAGIMWGMTTDVRIATGP